MKLLFTTYFFIFLLSQYAFSSDWNMSAAYSYPFELRLVSRDKIQKSFEYIRAKFQERPHPEDGNYISLWYTGQVPNLLDQTMEKFLNNDKIYSLTDRIKKLLKSNTRYCNSKNEQLDCYKMNAFYIPFLDVIFIDEDNDLEHFSSNLFHEIIHAYQYRYSFPFDAITMLERKQNKSSASERISLDEILNFIIFRYEAQANWYQTTLFETKEWFDLAEGPKYISGGIKILLGMATMLATLNQYITVESDTKYINSITPENLHRGTRSGHLYFKGKSAFKLPELILFNEKYSLNLGSNIDFKTHEIFYTLLGTAYFGNVPFVINEESQKANVMMIRNYYQEVVEKDWNNDSSHQELLNLIHNEGISPLAQWLTLDEKYFENLPQFDSFIKNRKKIIEMIQQQNSKYFVLNQNKISDVIMDKSKSGGSKKNADQVKSILFDINNRDKDQTNNKKEREKKIFEFILTGGEGSTPVIDLLSIKGNFREGFSLPMFVQPQINFLPPEYEINKDENKTNTSFTKGDYGGGQ